MDLEALQKNLEDRGFVYQYYPTAQAAADALLARDPGLTGCPEAAERVKELFTGAAVTFS